MSNIIIFFIISRKTMNIIGRDTKFFIKIIFTQKSVKILIFKFNIILIEINYIYIKEKKTNNKYYLKNS